LVGLTAGVSPNIDFLKNSELDLDKGVLVNEFLETNQKMFMPWRLRPV
jgi:3-phenylpropionate/trans-cinnamate dioxygenase ferredoxin reductase subunit